MARRDAERNKALIIAVFRDLVREAPDDRPLTMSDVVRRSGLGRGTVYRHFPDFGSLAFATLNEAYERLFGRSREKLSRAGDGAQVMSALRDHLVRSAALAHKNRKLLLADECQTSAAYTRARASMREFIREALAKAAGGSPGDHRLAVVSDLIAHCVEAEHLRDAPAAKPDYKASISIAVQLADRAISRL